MFLVKVTFGQGFSLLELMIVMAVVAILLMLATPNYFSANLRAEIKREMKISDVLKKNVLIYYKLNGKFPSDNAEAGLPNPEKLMSPYVFSSEVDEGVVNITFGHKIPGPAKGRVLSFRPLIVPDSPLTPVRWLCGNEEVVPGMEVIGTNRTDLAKEYLPRKCRELF